MFTTTGTGGCDIPADRIPVGTDAAAGTVAAGGIPEDDAATEGSFLRSAYGEVRVVIPGDVAAGDACGWADANGVSGDVMDGGDSWGNDAGDVGDPCVVPTGSPLPNASKSLSSIPTCPLCAARFTTNDSLSKCNS